MTIDIPKGYHAYHAAQLAVEKAREHLCEVDYQFNDIPMLVSPFSHPEDIAVIYTLRHELRRLSLT